MCVCNIVVEYRDGIRPSHWKRRETKRAKRRLKCSEVPRDFGECSLVVAYVKV